MHYFSRFFIIFIFFAFVPLICSEKINNIPRSTTTINIIHDNDGLPQETPERFGWSALIGKLLPSLLITSAVGATTGAISAFIENKKILSWPFSWLFLWGTRSVAVSSLVQDMKTYNVPHSKELAFVIARLADWITYLFCKTTYPIHSKYIYC